MNKTLGAILMLIIQIGTAMLAYPINVTAGSWCPLIWSIIDFLPPFTFIAWIKWCVCHQVNMTLIKHTFSFFFN